MKIEVGMYCYNKTNRKLGIGEIISFQRNNNVNVRYKNDIELVSIGNLIASYNIIDLIDEDDYIRLDGRGIAYFQVVKTPYNKLAIDDRSWNELEDFENDEIIAIITKEQMKSMEYKVGE